ncbi:MAG TPA: NAD-dependent succinate-semialdehyde dehydrogenase [Steroidobacteraceae bacterium]|nr:NAD-dependent succinate-semialdehyde dehydrogenase [Steroidobacteraceae bacterium]
MYPEQVLLYIDGAWSPAAAGEFLPVANPATGAVLGKVAHARIPDLERAVAAAQRGFEVWRKVSPLERAKLMRRASVLLRERAAGIAQLMTSEQGKVLAEAAAEVERTADGNDWLAGEAERIYGRTIAPRSANVTQVVIKDPVGIVVAFTPWNFPLFQMVRKIAGAIAAGCSIVIKGPEETPACCAELVRCYADAGVPAGVINLVYGTPAEISGFLVPHAAIRKVSFTGSTAVGKQLSALAGSHMKISTMELGGHAPVLVFADADIEAVAKALAGNKFRNAGQSCISPSRFLIEASAYPAFVQAFVAAASKVKVGNGLDAATNMGPLANPRRLKAVGELVQDAVAQGAELLLGGQRVGDTGNFFAPTVLGNVPLQARIMNEEPFGPVVPMRSFRTLAEALAEANRLPFGLGAFAFTRSIATARAVAAGIESGMVSINHFGLGNPEAPFGGVRDSGHGFEGGSEAIEAYLQTRFITMADL